MKFTIILSPHSTHGFQCYFALYLYPDVYVDHSRAVVINTCIAFILRRPFTTLWNDIDFNYFLALKQNIVYFKDGGSGSVTLFSKCEFSQTNTAGKSTLSLFPLKPSLSFSILEVFMIKCPLTDNV